MSEKSSPASVGNSTEKTKQGKAQAISAWIIRQHHDPRISMNMLGHVMSRVPCEMFCTGIHVLETQSSDGCGNLMRCDLVVEVGYQDGAFNCMSGCSRVLSRLSPDTLWENSLFRHMCQISCFAPSPNKQRLFTMDENSEALSQWNNYFPLS